MNQISNAEVKNDEPKVGGEVGLGEFLVALAAKKRTVIAVPFIVAVISALISLALPNIYKATTKLLPPQQAQSGANALLSQLGGMAGIAAGAAGIKNPNEMYIGMLKSRTIADRLIAQFDLKNLYETETQEETRKKLEESTSISSGKDGLITIEVENKDQKLVAKLANAYVNELFRLSRVLAVTEASQRRVFFERQLEQAKNNLATAEIQLKRSLDTHGVVSVDVESRAIVETIAKLRAQASAKEIQLNAMRPFVTSNHPDYKRVEEELGSLRTELSKLENGRVRTEEVSGDPSKTPQGFENIKLLRDVKYYQMLYELLAKQYEAARLDEAKDPSIVQVLDSAVDPERKFKPRRSVIVMTATSLALLFTLAWIFVKLTLQKARDARTGRSAEEKLVEVS